MLKQRVPDPGAEAGRRLCRKILCRNGADKTDDAEGDEHEAHFYDIGSVLTGDPYVNDCRHDKWDQKLKRRFQHLKKRRQYGFFFIILQINEE